MNDTIEDWGEMSKYLEFAEQPTPPYQQGEWKLIRPDGTVFTGDSPLKCVRNELAERVPSNVALGRIVRGMYEE